MNPEKRTDAPSLILCMKGVKRYTTVTPVWAAPMKLRAYAKLREVALPPEEDPNSDGYIVEQVGTKPNVVGFGGSVIWMVGEYFRDKYEEDPVLKETTYAERMHSELCELSDRVQKLEAFLKTEKFGELPPAEQEDMRQQLKSMQEYLWFLSRRVRRLGENHDNA